MRYREFTRLASCTPERLSHSKALILLAVNWDVSGVTTLEITQGG
jgi:hypothetical protein